jgi:hypothetical protein
MPRACPVESHACRYTQSNTKGYRCHVYEAVSVVKRFFSHTLSATPLRLRLLYCCFAL